MASRASHYSAAFEAFLKGRSIPYVSVESAKKALFSNTRLKSFDFVVYSKKGPNLLIDIKGRRGGKETWATERDVIDLAQWEQVFGEGFKAVLTFVYWTQSPSGPAGPGMFRHRDRWYQLMAIGLNEYRNRMRRRSTKWETVSLPAADFRSLARPLESWL